MKNKTKKIISILMIACVVVSMVFLEMERVMCHVQATTLQLTNPGMDSDNISTWDCIYFGHYFQGKYTPENILENTVDEGIYTDENGEKFICNINADGEFEYYKYEPIKWRVLSVNGDTAILMSSDNLDIRSYNDTTAEVSWQTSTLRSWLNGYSAENNSNAMDFTENNFIARAFTEKEKNALIVQDVENGDDGEEDMTQDQVYCLSYSEAKNDNYGFSDSNESRISKNTAYVSSGGTINADVSKLGTEGSGGFWWLRSPERGGVAARCVWSNGKVLSDDEDGEVQGCGVQSQNVAVRPVITLNLKENSVWSYAGTINSNGETTDGNEEVFVTDLKEPIIKSSDLYLGNTTEWDCIWFGKYPQSEITELDSIYEELLSINEWDDNGDVTIGEEKIHRIKESDGYRYFKYEPIKWRILAIDGRTAFVVSDLILDYRCYFINVGIDNTGWCDSDLRSWLNGYDGSINIEKIDYTGKGFLDYAFNESEKNIIKTVKLENSFLSDEKPSTYDKVFLLSGKDVLTAEYGFRQLDYGYNGKGHTLVCDRARCCRVSSYVDVVGFSAYWGNGEWWSRSANGVAGVMINSEGKYVDGTHSDWMYTNYSFGVRPAVKIDISDTSQWEYAGTVNSKDYIKETPVKTEYDTSTEGICSEEHLSELLGKERYRKYVGCISNIEMVIPGIKQTNMGNNTVCKDMVTQGICANNDYVLISAYCHDEEHNSVIYVMDKQTKKYLTTILLSVEDNAGLKKGNHVGGLAYGDGIIFIAGSGDNKVWKLPIEAVDYAVASGKDTYTATISKNKYINTTKASYIYWDNCFRELFVGHFDKNEKNTNENYMISYDVNTGYPTSSKIQLPLQTQGVSFGVGSDNKTYCICSKSYGKGNVSQIYVAEMKKIKGKAGYELTNWHKITVPNMSEDIQVWNGTLYNCFESAANYYNGEALRTTAFDRIPYINTRALISTVITKGERAKREEIMRYRMMSRTESGTEVDQIITEGACGANVNYCLYKDGSMVVSGQGSMEDYAEDNVPWSEYKDEIISVYVDSGVDGIGAYAFSDCDNLEKVTISEYRNADVNFMIGNYAFKNCLQLNKVELPDASYSIEDTAFDEKSEIQICSDAASIVKYCNQYDNLSLHKHHMEYKNTVQPTCLEIGYDSYVCDCGYEEIANVVEATKAHTFKEVERVEATPDEEGYIEYQCSGCSDIYYETLEYEGQESSTENPGGQKPLPETPAGQTTEKTQPEENIDTLPVIGTEVVSSAGIYKVTKSTSSKKEVTYVKPKSKNKTSVFVPDTIKISGFTYKVTSVTANALSGNKKVTKVTVGKNVTSIGKNAFKKCTKLKTVTLKSTSLKSIGSNAFYGDKNLKTITIKSSKLTSKSVGKNAFKGTNEKLTIKVPKKKVSSYKNFLGKKGNKNVKVKK